MDFTEDEQLQRLLDDTERAMRLFATVKDDPATAADVKQVVDNLFRDIGRVVYNLHWGAPDLPSSEQGVELAEFTSEADTEAIAIEPRGVPGLDELPPFPDATDVPDTDDPREFDGEDAVGGWYTDEVELPPDKLIHFGPEDGLREDVPSSGDVSRSDTLPPRDE